MKFILITYPLLLIATVTLLWLRIPFKTQEVKIVSPLPHVASVSATPRKLSDLVLNYAFQAFPNDKEKVVAIMNEHHMDCSWGKGTHHVGLFAIDINDPRAKGKNLNDCLDNIDVAKAIYQSEGLAPWGK